MPKFVITVSVDAHAHYATTIDAETADLAKQFAKQHEDQLTWHSLGTTEYDDRDWDNIEPEQVGDNFVIDPAGPEDPQPLHSTICPDAKSISSSSSRRPGPGSMAFWTGELDSFLEL